MRDRLPKIHAQAVAAADTTVALLGAGAGRNPHDRGLRDLVGELATLSPALRTRWAQHNVRLYHGGVKRFHHAEVGPLELTYQSLPLTTSLKAVHTLTAYTAEPGINSEDRLKAPRQLGGALRDHEDGTELTP